MIMSIPLTVSSQKCMLLLGWYFAWPNIFAYGLVSHLLFTFLTVLCTCLCNHLCDHYCFPTGASVATFACGTGTLFDENLQVCNWAYAVNCQCATPITPPPTNVKGTQIIPILLTNWSHVFVLMLLWSDHKIYSTWTSNATSNATTHNKSNNT